MLKNEHGFFLQSHELLPKFGLPADGHLPPEGFGPRVVDGITFICRPAPEPKFRSDGRKVKVSKHRIFYHCDACRRYIPAGRAYQHRKGREHKNNASA